MRFLPLIILLTGCASQPYVEVGYGPKLRGNWQGTGGVVDAAVGVQWENALCELRHTSNLTSGWPFNDREESTLDRISCGLRMMLGQ